MRPRLHNLKQARTFLYKYSYCLQFCDNKKGAFSHCRKWAGMSHASSTKNKKKTMPV